MNDSGVWIYATVLILIWVFYTKFRHQKSVENITIRTDAIEAGLTEPASLHPVVDESLCLGCGACVKACPEQDKHSVLGIVNGKAELIEPTNCIGHGACKSACPFNAISLVFGTARRGLDIPVLDPQFQTTVPGIYIAGELGGMGLIRNAIIQGLQAIDAILEGLKSKNDKVLDVVIVGAGPAGFAATLRAKEQKMAYVTIEQGSLGGCVFQYPRRKLVMTSSVNLPFVGTCKFSEVSKEVLLDFWDEAEKKSGIKVNYLEKLIDIVPDEQGFKVVTEKATYTTSSVLLAIGRRGTPRKLDVDGEGLSKVVYSLIDPEQYKGKHVLIVGGGDSALEAAISIADEDNTTVTLSYRGDAFARAKRKNRERLDEMMQNGKVNVYLSSNVFRFEKKTVTLKTVDAELILENDAAIICAGGILPNSFLKKIGISVDTKYGTA